jgi:hypothetical protein
LHQQGLLHKNERLSHKQIQASSKASKLVSVINMPSLNVLLRKSASFHDGDLPV